MTDCAVGLECLIDFAVGICKIRLSSCARYTGYRIDYDALFLYETLLEERSESDKRACGVAAGIGYEFCCL